MIKIEKTEVFGWEAAIRGMRNPMNSWDTSDSYWTHIEDTETLQTAPFEFFVGDADKELMMKLAKGGSVHAKYRRFIVVYVDITAPLYWWKEFDTYRVGVAYNPTDIEMNSCSTMHKIHAKEFTLDDFSCEHLTNHFKTDLECTVLSLNYARKRFLETGDKLFWYQMIQLLPSSYNQKRSVMLNYEVLSNIYRWRRNHKLDEWHVFCDWIEGLPHSDIITLDTNERNDSDA